MTKFLGTASTRFLESNDITVTKFLDVTVTKFLASNETAVTKYLASNDITVTKFLELAIGNFLLDDEAVGTFLDTTISGFSHFLNYDDDDTYFDYRPVTKFMEAEDGIAVTKYLDDNDISVTKFMDAAEDGIAVTKYLESAPTYNTFPANSENNKRNVNMTIIQFLDDYMYANPTHMLHDVPRDNDISVTKFLQQNANVTQSEQNGQRMNIIQFLQDNDISVTKFMNYMENHLDEPS